MENKGILMHLQNRLIRVFKYFCSLFSAVVLVNLVFFSSLEKMGRVIAIALCFFIALYFGMRLLARRSALGLCSVPADDLRESIHYCDGVSLALLILLFTL